jgi:hypothetical protein
MALSPASIPFPYRLFHLYIEPLLFIPAGIYLSLFRPTSFLGSTCPASLAAPYPPNNHNSYLSSSAAVPSPLTLFLLHNTAALYLLFMVSELLVLRATNEIAVWRALVFAYLCCDVGHLVAFGWAAPGMFTTGEKGMGIWRFEDWVNVGILMFGAGLRIGVLCGVGMGGVGEGRGKKAA